MIINLVVVILFLYGHNLSERSILIDAACFGVSTTFIDTLYIKHRIDELAQQGALPDQAPTSVILAHLPQNPMLLALIIGSMFAIITPILNGVVFRSEIMETSIYDGKISNTGESPTGTAKAVLDGALKNERIIYGNGSETLRAIVAYHPITASFIDEQLTHIAEMRCYHDLLYL
ncbi:MAG: hypothetical protein PHN26_05425 [Eubacteriaceae bacterium]|nr:hypothetical protein [Eubacteriaceae bacterium]